MLCLMDPSNLLFTRCVLFIIYILTRGECGAAPVVCFWIPAVELLLRDDMSGLHQ